MADIKDRIQKLLALGASPNENEAKAALLKAKELMAKHKLTEFDIAENQDEFTNRVCDEVAWTTDSGEIWMINLCKLICDNHCCISSWYTPHKTRTHKLCVSGMQNDVDLCEAIIKYAVEFVRDAVRSLQRKYKSDRKNISSSYAKGFILGLELAYEDQKEEHPEWALVVVKPQEVQEYENKLGTRQVRAKETGFNPLIHMMGLRDGKEFNKKKRLEGHA